MGLFGYCLEIKKIKLFKMQKVVWITLFYALCKLKYWIPDILGFTLYLKVRFVQRVSFIISDNNRLLFLTE